MEIDWYHKEDRNIDPMGNLEAYLLQNGLVKFVKGEQTPMGYQPAYVEATCDFTIHVVKKQGESEGD